MALKETSVARPWQAQPLRADHNSLVQSRETQTKHREYSCKFFTAGNPSHPPPAYRCVDLLSSSLKYGGDGPGGGEGGEKTEAGPQSPRMRRMDAHKGGGL